LYIVQFGLSDIFSSLCCDNTVHFELAGTCISLCCDYTVHFEPPAVYTSLCYDYIVVWTIGHLQHSALRLHCTV
jgi:hypothetical protein